MTTDTVEQQIASLRSQIADAESKQQILMGERDDGDLAYEAIVARNATAKKRVDEINAEIAHLTNVVLPMLNSALKAAQKRADAAKAAAAEGDVRKRAEQAQPIAERLAAVGKKADTTAREYCAALAEIDTCIRELSTLGIPTPSRDLVRVNKNRAHLAAMMSLDQARPIAPRERTLYDPLTKGWAKPALDWIAARLSKTETKAAKAA
jgi:hypothetical protein